jgi:hypothetical protein
MKRRAAKPMARKGLAKATPKRAAAKKAARERARRVKPPKLRAAAADPALDGIECRDRSNASLAIGAGPPLSISKKRRLQCDQQKASVAARFDHLEATTSIGKIKAVCQLPPRIWRINQAARKPSPVLATSLDLEFLDGLDTCLRH